MPTQKVDARTRASMVGVANPTSWTESDKNTLRVFINTQTGQRLINIMRNNALSMTVNAVHAPAAELVEKAGVAKGMQMSFGALCQLAATDPLKVVQHDGQFSLTESSEKPDPDNEESEEDEDGPSAGLSNPGSPIFAPNE